MDPSIFSLEKKTSKTRVELPIKTARAPFGFQVHKERDRLEKPLHPFFQGASKSVETWYQRNHDDFQLGITFLKDEPTIFC